MVKLTAVTLAISTALISASALADVPCNNLADWNSNAVYATPGTEVQYQKSAYENKWWTQGDAPASGDSNPWKLLGACSYLPVQQDTVTVKMNTFPQSGIIFTDPQGKKFTLTNPNTSIQLPYAAPVTYTISATGGAITPASFSADSKAQNLQLTYQPFPPFSPHAVVGYIDASQDGYAEKALGMSSPTSTPTNLSNLREMGYGTIVWGWLSVGTDSDPTAVSIFGGADASTAQIIKTVTPLAKQEGFRVLISTGGSAGIFEHGLINKNAQGIGTSLTPDQIKTLAQNIVNTLKQYQLDGIDFDLEQHVNGDFLNQLITDMRQIWPAIVVTAAPQLNNTGSAVQLVSTGTDTDYQQAIDNNNFTALFVQDYCTGGYQLNSAGKLTTSGGYSETDSGFVSPSYYNVLSQLPANSPTLIYLGEPVSNTAAGCSANVYASGADASTIWQQLAGQYKSLLDKQSYGGAMDWSVNWDSQNKPNFGFVKTIGPVFQ